MGIRFVEKYENLSDNELAHLTQNGDSEAGVTLLRKYMPLIKSRASHFYNGTVEMEDLVQEGIIALYLSIKKYDLSLSSFSTFARLCIDRALISEVRTQARKKQIPSDKLVSLEENVVLSYEGNPENILIETEDVSALHKNIKGSLSKREYKTLLLFLHSYSIKEIAVLLKTSEKSVNNTLYRIRNKLISL